MRVAVFYATYGHWTQSLLNAGIRDIAYHFQPSLKEDPESDMGMNPDILSSRILRMNFSEIDFRRPDSNDEPYDLMVGSPPCVGFSKANPKARPDHPLNKHTLNFFKWVLLNGPKHFLMETVPDILKSQDPIGGGGGIFNQCFHLIRTGYRWDYALFDAGKYGGAQTRKRLIVWGDRRDLDLYESPLCTLTQPDKVLIEDVLSPDLIRCWDGMEPDGKTMMSLIGKNGKRIAGAWSLLTPKKIYNRTLKPKGQMFTITSTSVRDCIHYSKERLLSIPELKVLMGFPIGYWIPPVNAEMASKIIASGVDVRFGSYLLNHIRSVLEA